MQKIYSQNCLALLFMFLTMSFNALAQDDDTPQGVDTFPKVRLGFYSQTNSYRQLLLGFQNGLATEGIDPGYDAVNIFNLPNDMYFFCNNLELFIQGVGGFNPNSSYPIGIKSNVTGNITIKLESTENFSAAQSFYIYDSYTNQLHNLRDGNLVTSVTSGTFNDRFSLRFLNQAALNTDNPALNKDLVVSYGYNDNLLTIANTSTENTVLSVAIFNFIGQNTHTYKVSAEAQNFIQIPVTGLSAGTYIVKTITTAGTVTKKIIVR